LISTFSDYYTTNKEERLTTVILGLLDDLDQLVNKVLDVHQTVGNIRRLVDLDEGLVKDGNDLLQDLTRDTLEDQFHESLLLADPKVGHQQLLELADQIGLGTLMLVPMLLLVMVLVMMMMMVVVVVVLVLLSVWHVQELFVRTTIQAAARRVAFA